MSGVLSAPLPQVRTAILSSCAVEGVIPEGLVDGDRFVTLGEPVDVVAGAMAALVLSERRKNVIYHLAETHSPKTVAPGAVGALVLSEHRKHVIYHLAETLRLAIAATARAANRERPLRTAANRERPLWTARVSTQR
eukprot:3269890-Pyramimonas_sp.AAC.2